MATLIFYQRILYSRGWSCVSQHLRNISKPFFTRVQVTANWHTCPDPHFGSWNCLPHQAHIALSELLSCTDKQGSSLGSFPTSPPLYPHFNRTSGFWPCVKSCLVGGSDKYCASSWLLAFCEACSGLRSGAWPWKRNNGRLGAFN